MKDFEEQNLKGPTSITYNKEDNILYVTDAGNFSQSPLYPNNGSLYIIDIDSKIMRPILHQCLSYPSDVLYDSEKGFVYLAETFANRIIKLTEYPQGVYNSSVFFQFHGRLGPTSLAMDELGNLYVARYEYPLVK